MVDIPAFCKNCGHLFPFKGIDFPGKQPAGLNIKIKFSNSTITCPQCGNQAQIADGDYAVVDNVLTLLSGPTTTVIQLQKLKEIVDQLAISSISAQEAITQAEFVTPEFGQLLLNLIAILGLTNLDRALATLSLILTFYIYLETGNQQKDMQQELQKQTAILEQLLSKTESDDPTANAEPTPSPPPTPHRRPDK